MKKHRIGLIRVVTQEENLVRIHGDIIEKAYPFLEVISRCIPEQPDGVHDEESEGRATPKIIKEALRFAEEGVEAIIISCAGDPAVLKLRDILSIPVIGAGEAAASAAARHVGRIGVIGIMKDVPSSYRRILGNRIVDEPIANRITCTGDLMTLQGQAHMIERAEALKDAGADVLAFACTGLSTIGFRTILEQKLQIPIIDAVLSEGAFACLELACKI